MTSTQRKDDTSDGTRSSHAQPPPQDDVAQSGGAGEGDSSATKDASESEEKPETD